MGWEQRAGRKPLYFESIRVDGRVVRTCFGGGPEAHLAAKMTALRRVDKTTARAVGDAEAAKIATLTREMRTLEGICALLSSAKMIASGFHRHDRGTWRRRRDHGQGR